MSGIAGIIHFDGRPVEPGQVEAMTAAMHYRGPDGINHWRRGNVALGQCMLRTTPESLEETQPLTNEDQSLVLVMDGRVDNYAELRSELLGRGAVLRTRADAELVLRAYEVWGEECPDRIIGECVFFIWDARKQCLFAARDAAGTRHFYCHSGTNWFAFASEIKGLLTLPIERRLNDSRLLDYLVPEFDRDDEVSTFFQGILRMPAGHAMSISVGGSRLWRWWNPEELTEEKFASLNECAEAFMDQLRVAVKCRLRSIKPVGALLSGGLDSSAIVGLVSKEFRDQLLQPLQTFSMIQDDRENCMEWGAIQEMLLADPWLRSTILTSSTTEDSWPSLFADISKADEPFAPAYGYTSGIVNEAVALAGCGVVLEGMAGDVLFYSLPQTLRNALQNLQYSQILAALATYRRHGFKASGKYVLYEVADTFAPSAFRAQLHLWRDRRKVKSGDLQLLYRESAKTYLMSKRAASFLRNVSQQAVTDQIAHARTFTSGLISFPHEVGGPRYLGCGVEPRSPYSDRRLIEFAIRMPIAAKLAVPWYKYLMRLGLGGVLPEPVRWRQDVGNHPGWTFYDRLVLAISSRAASTWNDPHVIKAIGKWVRPEVAQAYWTEHSRGSSRASGQVALRLFILSKWITSHNFG